MKLTKINKLIKCDTILCNQNATYKLDMDSFKGSSFLCDKCILNLKNLFKRNTANDK